MAEAVRLLIWDLDETFWRGTLTEGGVDRPVSENVEIVKTLVDRGIMNSICSRNHFDEAKAVLVEMGVWEHVIFPSIDWTAKGARVAEIIDQCQLRAASVMFVDDNPANLAEVLAANPGIQVADPSFLPQLLADARFRGKDDRDHSRLQQYKVLESKKAEKAAFQNDNEAFLRSSDIAVYFEYDIEKHLDRAVELINRTNQLNFTKSRLPEDPDAAKRQLRQLVGHFDTRAALVGVRDKYGDYGLAGFYAVSGGCGQAQLLHFAFSCRILGMGVEQWLYDRLRRPKINVVGEVLSRLDGAPAPDWINLVPAADAGHSAQDCDQDWKAEFHLRGGCEMDIVDHLLRMRFTSTNLEAGYVKGHKVIWKNHGAMLCQAAQGNSPEILQKLAEVGIDASDVRSSLFDAKPGSLLIVSLTGDIQSRVFRHKTLNIRVPIMYYDLDYSFEGNNKDDHTFFNSSRLAEFFAKYDYSQADIDECQKIRAVLESEFIREDFYFTCEDCYAQIAKALPRDCYTIFLLPNSTEYRDDESKFRHEFQHGVNSAVKKSIHGQAHIAALDLTELVQERGAYIANAMLHYSRDFYFFLYQRISDMYGEWLASRQRAQEAAPDERRFLAGARL